MLNQPQLAMVSQATSKPRIARLQDCSEKLQNFKDRMLVFFLETGNSTPGDAGLLGQE